MRGWHNPRGVDFGPYSIDGWQGWQGGGIYGLVAGETTGAPILFRAFFKGGEVTRPSLHFARLTQSLVKYHCGPRPRDGRTHQLDPRFTVVRNASTTNVRSVMEEVQKSAEEESQQDLS